MYIWITIIMIGGLFLAWLCAEIGLWLEHISENNINIFKLDSFGNFIDERLKKIDDRLDKAIDKFNKNGSYFDENKVDLTKMKFSPTGQVIPNNRKIEINPDTGSRSYSYLSSLNKNLQEKQDKIMKVKIYKTYQPKYTIYKPINHIFRVKDYNDEYYEIMDDVYNLTGYIKNIILKEHCYTIENKESNFEYRIVNILKALDDNKKERKIGPEEAELRLREIGITVKTEKDTITKDSKNISSVIPSNDDRYEMEFKGMKIPRINPNIIPPKIDNNHWNNLEFDSNNNIYDKELELKQTELNELKDKVVKLQKELENNLTLTGSVDTRTLINMETRIKILEKQMLKTV